MRFFRYFPKVTYNQEESVNIIVRGKIRDMVKSNTVLFYPYTVSDGERPDIISHKYYGNSDYAWIIFYANDIFDPFYDWPLEYDEFNLFIAAKYGSIESSQTTVHHYENKKGLWIDETTYLATADNERSSVSQYDYELSLNEAKRNIKLVDNAYLGKIVEELKGLF